SFLLCEVETGEHGESYTIKELKTGGRNGESEAEILEKFCTFLQKYKPRIVSFNGKTFDLPVIQYRSMMHKIPCPWLYSKEMSYKFNHEPHCDLIDAFSNFGSSARVKMSEVAALLGVPCKQTGSGNEVLQMHSDGKLEAICNYCEEDVLATYMLYLYHQMHRGVLALDIFERNFATAMERMSD
ncbi:MAG: ribonuclease H-like domain-containing protein, partial [Proteobacteria bacterium]|nr:ribonuclease H-like domain-containing protein [Pseudomonadota bacterium]